MSAPSLSPSSSTTLWAKASKEWVIPAKPKPGRKPKDDASAEADGEGKAKKVQNRAAQRAFRERKQTQLQELQARINEYERGEVERNVALQAIGKRLKDENDLLRAENEALRREVAILRGKAGRSSSLPADSDRKRPASPSGSSGQGGHKRLRGGKVTTSRSSGRTCAPSSEPLSHLSKNISAASVHSPSLVSSPISTVSSPSPDLNTSGPSPTAHSLLKASSSHAEEISVFEPGISFDDINCGFCSEDTLCVCRELARTAAAGVVPGAEQEAPKATEQVVTAPVSILEDLPPYQPAVPLRRRRITGKPRSIFPIAPAESKPGAPVCSGDPSNCDACADDPFGQAFCNALGDSFRCDDCPNRTASRREKPLGVEGIAQNEHGSGLLCCGDPRICGGGCGMPASLKASGSSSHPIEIEIETEDAITESPTSEPPDKIPCSTAWAQLKAHPAIGFADLSLLADVVARRTKCTGPQVVISPAPGTCTPERSNTPDTDSNQAQSVGPSTGRQSPRPHLVPQEDLIHCGRVRVMEVQAEGVREALAMLDAQVRPVSLN
ncbi:hypothetical protein BOTBODRAFT_183963 [Botryobasidium botryosum FD-172 SS1]|uniref:BZIP domain-containing protein n=1 Tax=Botryobasidium botryosum (strain FD-172 SS1) TaxID=930990 RepID=A0A067N853_BOTB1|nr:hypothetical protein BOTBODRAFT_183963 [Botryobasidium botryosum FD-172 SS1]